MRWRWPTSSAAALSRPTTSLEAAREAGVITASDERAAAQPKRSLFASIFGTAKDAG